MTVLQTSLLLAIVYAYRHEKIALQIKPLFAPEEGCFHRQSTLRPLTQHSQTTNTQHTQTINPAHSDH